MSRGQATPRTSQDERRASMLGGTAVLDAPAAATCRRQGRRVRRATRRARPPPRPRPGGPCPRIAGHPARASGRGGETLPLGDAVVVRYPSPPPQRGFEVQNAEGSVSLGRREISIYVERRNFYGKKDSIHHHLLEAVSKTANVLELRQKLLYTTPSRWWWWWWWWW